LLDDSLVALESTLESERSENSLWYTLGLLATLVSTALLALLCLALLRGRSQQRQRSSHADDAREESIHQLLNEIETLAEGNLDTKATVTEGVTGAMLQLRRPVQVHDSLPTQALSNRVRLADRQPTYERCLTRFPSFR